MSFSLSSLLPWNWGSSGSGTVGSFDESMLPGASTSYAPSTSAQDASALSGLSSGGMNWAGLSSGLSNLSKQLQGGTSASDKLQGSQAVASTVSGGVLSPQAASGGASALASADTARQQLAQYLILAAMQGKGRGKSGGGLLG